MIFPALVFFLLLFRVLFQKEPSTPFRRVGNPTPFGETNTPARRGSRETKKGLLSVQTLLRLEEPPEYSAATISKIFREEKRKITKRNKRNACSQTIDEAEGNIIQQSSWNFDVTQRVSPGAHF